MTDVITMLAVYYMCSSEAETRHLSFEEARSCAAVYDGVKGHFAPNTDIAPDGLRGRAAHNQAAYLAFKHWEETHPEIVDPLKAQARRQSTLFLSDAR